MFLLPRMTPEDPFNAKERSLERTVFFDSGNSVVRTAGIKNAGILFLKPQTMIQAVVSGKYFLI